MFIGALSLSAAIVAQAVPDSSELPVVSADNNPVLSSSPTGATGNPFSIATEDIPNTLSNDSHKEFFDTRDSYTNNTVYSSLGNPMPDITANPANIARLEKWALQDPNNAMVWLTTNATEEQQSRFGQHIVTALLPNDSDTVYEYKDSIKDLNILAMVERHIAVQMAKTNPALAFEWALELENEFSRNSALATVAQKWIKEDHNAVIERFAAIHNTVLKDKLIERISYPLASALVSSDPYQALSWADSLTNRHKSVALPAIFYYWLNENHQEARLWLQALPDSKTKFEMINTDFWHALSNDLDHATNTLLELAAKAAVNDFQISSMTKTLNEKRPEEVEAFIATLPDEHMVRMARRSVRDQLMWKEPAEYLSLYGTLDNEDQTHHLAQILNYLLHEESDLVTNWLATTRISSDELQRANVLAEEYRMMHVGC